MVNKLSEIDRNNLEKASENNPGCSIVFDNPFLGGSDRKSFGLVPENWNKETLYFTYDKLIED